MRIAVIGAGITGLAAAWLLSRRHEVTVYEQQGRIGGHSNTIDVPGKGSAAPTPVDTGFVIYNEQTYPNLTRLFAHIGVPTQSSAMSFAVSLDRGRLEYAGTSVFSLFAQKRNLLRPSYHLMLRDIQRFYREAPSLLDDPAAGSVSLAEYLVERRYGHGFIYDHLLPMGAAVWSTTIGRMLAFPAQSFVRFFHNHGLFKLTDRPQWRTVTDGSRAYVQRLAAGFRERILTGRPVTSIRRLPGGVTLADALGGVESFEQVVVATHADQALALLADPSAEEQRILGTFRYQANRAVVHRDPWLMPRRRRAWASWNYLANATRNRHATVSVTYWMNALQGIPRGNPLFVSLNPLCEPRAELKVREFIYDHSILDARAIAAQAEISTLQGQRRTWYCGSYCGYGFHEDGLSAGLAVAEALGGERPWTVVEASPAGRNATPRAPRLAEAG